MSYKKKISVLIVTVSLFFLIPISSVFASMHTESYSPLYYWSTDYDQLMELGATDSGKAFVLYQNAWDITTNNVVGWHLYYYEIVSGTVALEENPSDGIVDIIAYNGSVEYNVYRLSYRDNKEENPSGADPDLGGWRLYREGLTVSTGQILNDARFILKPFESVQVDHYASKFLIMNSGTAVVNQSDGSPVVLTDYSLGLQKDTLYKGDQLIVEVEGYKKLKYSINGEYIGSYELDAAGYSHNIMGHAELLEKFDGETSLDLEVEAYKSITDSTYHQLYEFPVTLKLDQVSPDVVDVGLDDGWADEIKQPTKPDNNWDLIGWVRYLVDWIVYAFKVVIYTISTLGSTIGDLMTSFGGITATLSNFFSFMPAPVMALLLVAVSVGVILRVFGR